MLSQGKETVTPNGLEYENRYFQTLRGSRKESEPEISYSPTCSQWTSLVRFLTLAWMQMEEAQKERNMKDKDLLERITLSPKVMAGKPIIKGTRLTVEYILNLLAHGATTEEILEEYKGLKTEDIQACFLFATRSLSDTEFMPLTVETA
jgi:uncharacterized protein (DUF433 family)